MNKLESQQIARQYAKALFDLSLDQQKVAEVATDAERVSQLFESTPELNDYLANPLIEAAEKKELLNDKVLSQLNPLWKNIVPLLAENDRLALLPLVASQIKILEQHANKKAVAKVTLPVQVPQSTLDKLSQKLESVLGLNAVELDVTIDPTIIAGAVVTVADQVFDGSYTNKLMQLQQHR